MAGSEIELYSSKSSSIVLIQGKNQHIVKRFKTSSSRVSSEISAHSSLSSNIPGIVQCIGWSFISYELKLEYCEKGSLRLYIESRQGHFFSEKELLNAFFSMIGTIRELHKRRKVHRAINADNWLVTAEGQIKLCDLGCLKEISVGCSNEFHSLENGEFTKRIFAHDALLLGLVFLQMATFDFSISPLELTLDAVIERCRHYSFKVADIINELVFSRDVIRQSEIMRHFDQLSERAQIDSPEDVLDYLFDSKKVVCNYCMELKAWVLRLPCTHSVCKDCLEIGSEDNQFYCEPCKSSMNSTTLSVPSEDMCTSFSQYTFA